MHFIALATLLFVFEAMISSAKKETILLDGQTVDYLVKQREDLELRKLGPDERQQLIEAFIEDEILYREAYNRGLDKADTRMRRNLIRNMRSLLMGEIPEPTQEELKRYFEANRAKYSRPPTLSLQQVFYRDHSTVPDDLLDQLRAGLDPTTVGESFRAYGRSLSRVSTRELSAIFGADAARSIISLEDDQWHGPFESLHGLHFLRITDRQPSQEAHYEDVRFYLEKEWPMVQSRAIIEKEVEKLKKQYDIIIEVPELRP